MSQLRRWWHPADGAGMPDVQGGHEPAGVAALRIGSLRCESVQALTVLGFAAPIAIYLWYLEHYTRNIVAGDQWEDVSLIRMSYDGHLTLSALWAQHNENRIIFPNLIVLALSRVTAFNITVEEYVSAVLLFTTVALIIVAHRRRSPGRQWIAYCPVVIVMLSIVQGGNTLWGFQLAWYLVLASLAAVIYFLDAKVLSVAGFLASIVFAVIGSYSSFQGLFIWVAGLALLYYRKRRPLALVLWVGGAVVTTALYFYHLDRDKGVAPYLTASHFPATAVRFFFVSIGDVLGIPLTSYDLGSDLVLVFGCVIVGLAIYMLWSGRHRDSDSAAPVGNVLIVVGLLFALSTTWGRTWGGPSAAAASRYTTYDLLIVVGIYLTYLSRPQRLGRSEMHSATRVVLGVLLTAIIVVQFPIGFVNGILWARKNDAHLTTTAAATVIANRIPRPLVASSLYPGYPTQALLDDIGVLSSHRLSLYSDQTALEGYREQADIEQRSGVFKYRAPKSLPPTEVEVPHNGAVVTGRTELAAYVERSLDPRSVSFDLRGPTIGDRVLGAARAVPFGWLLVWQTRRVPNGTYDVCSVVHGKSGHVTQSAFISITVKN